VLTRHHGRAEPATGRARLRAIAVLLGATALLLAGCGIVSKPGTYPDPNGPRNAKGALVDPKTGILLPGICDDGI
jgi:hypothetical protein